MRYVVATGSPVYGFVLYGPFDRQIEAHEWAANELSDHDTWWLIDVSPPRKTP